MNQTNQPTVAQSTPSASAQTSLAMGPALVAGLLGGLMASLTAISYASLVFSGPLAAYAAQGISLGIFSAMVLGLCLTWLGSFPGTIVIPQPRIAPLSLLVVSAATIPYGVQLSGDELFYTVLASLCIAAAFTGLVLLVLGIFKAGRFVRFVPYPVVGGFLAGAGWLLVAGAFKLMTSKPFGMEVAQASVGESLMVLVPGILLALTWILLLRRGAHYLASPTTLLGGMLLFYLVLFLVGGDLDSAFEQGLLLGPLPDGGGWSLITPKALSEANWGFLLSQAGVFGTIALVATLSLLLHASSIELVAKADIDLNQEMRAAGIANLASGSVSGLIGFHAIGPTMLTIKLGSPRRLAGMSAAAFPAAVLLLGQDALAYLPRFIVGGLLLFLGLSFLVEWLYDGYRRLSRADYAVVWVILLTVAWFGYLEGIAVGMIAALALFVVNYSRINVVRQALSGALLQSNVDRPKDVRKLLRREGDRTLVFKLQGFVFFGTANGLLEQINQRLDACGDRPPRFVVLDFRAVTGFDTSAGMSFVKLSQLAEKHDFTVVLADASETILGVLKRGGVDIGGERCIIVPDMDRALERCEEMLLVQLTSVNYRPPTGFEDLVREAGLDEEQARILMKSMDRISLPAGETFIEAGTQATDLFFLEQGSVTVSIKMMDGKMVRVRSMGGGTIIGELGLYLNQKRTASVTTDLPCELLRLDLDALGRLERAHPDLALAFHKHMIRQVGQQLVQTKMALEQIH